MTGRRPVDGVEEAVGLALQHVHRAVLQAGWRVQDAEAAEAAARADWEAAPRRREAEAARCWVAAQDAAAAARRRRSALEDAARVLESARGRS